MPTTEERITAIAASARQNKKGRAVTLDLYAYPDGSSFVRPKGKTGVGHSVRCEDDAAMAYVLKAVVKEIRASTSTT
jgi:hypothetical protein